MPLDRHFVVHDQDDCVRLRQRGSYRQCGTSHLPPISLATDRALIDWPDYWSFPSVNSIETEVK
jgi:hypothetical protein